MVRAHNGITKLLGWCRGNIGIAMTKLGPTLPPLLVLDSLLGVVSEKPVA